MAEQLGDAVLVLRTDETGLNAGMQRAKTGAESVGATFQRTSAIVTTSAAAQRAGLQNLGRQIGDIATMYSLGMRPSQIFASQIGQVTDAVQMATGGTSKLASFLGGPWGVAIMIAVQALGPFIGKLFETKSALDDVGDAAEQAMAKLRQSMRETSDFQNAIDENTKKLVTSMAKVGQANDEIARTQRLINEMGTTPGGAQAMEGLNARLGRLEADRAKAQKELDAARSNLDEIRATSRAKETQDANEKHLHDKPDKPKRPRKERGPSGEEIEARFDDERAGFMQQYNSALGATARSAEAAAEYELRNLELTRIRTNAHIEANKDYSEAQKRQLVEANEEAAQAARDRIEFDKRRRLEDEAEQISAEHYRAAKDALQIQFDLADTEAERKAIALKILDADHAYLRAKLEAVTASQTASDAEKRNAQAALDALIATAGVRREGVARANETTVERYLRDLNKTPEQINEAIDRIKIDGLQELNSDLADVILRTKSLGQVFHDVAGMIVRDLLQIALQRAIIQPLANMLFPGGGVSASSIARLTPGVSSVMDNFAGLFADGGAISAGQWGIVGEHGPEIFVPQSTGTILPNSALGGRASSAVRVVIEDTTGLFRTRVEEISGEVTMQGLQAAAPAIRDAAVAETARLITRPGM